MSEINKASITDTFTKSISDGEAIARIIQEKADDLAFLMGATAWRAICSDCKP